MPKPVKIRIPWGRIVRAAVSGIRASLAEVAEAVDADSDGGAQITRAELGDIIDAGLSKVRAELVRVAVAELRVRG